MKRGIPGILVSACAVLLLSSPLIAAERDSGREAFGPRRSKATGKVKMISASPRAEKVNAVTPSLTAPVAVRGNWKATAPIVWDAASGTLRRPTPAETADLVRSLQQLTSRRARIQPSVNADGARSGTLNGAFANVLVGRATADGGVETRCVETFEEAAEFLGLVSDDAGPTVQ